MKLSEICKFVGGEIADTGDMDIARLAKIEEAGPGDITFFANPKYRKYLTSTAASAILVARDARLDELVRRQAPVHVIRVNDPHVAFLLLIDKFHPPALPLEKGIHPTAVISASAKIGNDVAIGAHVFVGDRALIGDNCSLYPGTVMAERAHVGNNCMLYSNVNVREACIIGNNVTVHSGTVIGSDGFGFAPKADGTYEKIPQRGIVVIDDDVEIGANCTIDRATIGETRIERGVKLDNLIHVAHNVVIGEHTVVAAQTGISGSTKIGKKCAIGGQVGFVGHITIADRTTLGAQSGVAKSVTEEGKTYFGYPAREIQKTLKIEAALKQLPDLLTHFRNIEQRLSDLEQRVSQSAKNEQDH